MINNFFIITTTISTRITTTAPAPAIMSRTIQLHQWNHQVHNENHLHQNSSWNQPHHPTTCHHHHVHHQRQQQQLLHHRRTTTEKVVEEVKIIVLVLIPSLHRRNIKRRNICSVHFIREMIL